MATSAQEEFDDLVRDKSRRTRHPSDDVDDDVDSSHDLSDRNHIQAGATSRSYQSTTRARDHNGVDTDEDDDDVDNDFVSQGSFIRSRNTIPLTRFEANTGPKGVISDAQNYRDSQKQHHLSSRLSLAGASSISNVLRDLDIEEKPTRGARGREFINDGTEEKIDDDDAELEDDDFMSSWRANRIQQMQSTEWQGQHNLRERKGERGWGTLATVDSDGYLEAVEQTPASTVVAVYIYDDESEVSLALEDCLRDVARKHTGTRFVRFHFAEAEMEPAGVPALIAYRGGDKTAGLVPLVDEFPDDADLDATSLETLLRQHHII